MSKNYTCLVLTAVFLLAFSTYLKGNYVFKFGPKLNQLGGAPDNKPEIGDGLPSSFLFYDNEIFIVDAQKYRVVKYNINSKSFKTVINYKSFSSPAPYIIDIAIDKNGNIYLANNTNQLIMVYNKNKLIRKIGEFTYLTAISIKNNKLFAYDGGANGCLRFSLNGEFECFYPDTSYLPVVNSKNWVATTSIHKNKVTISFVSDADRKTLPFASYKSKNPAIQILHALPLYCDSKDNLYVLLTTGINRKPESTSILIYNSKGTLITRKPIPINLKFLTSISRHYRIHSNFLYFFDFTANAYYIKKIHLK